METRANLTIVGIFVLAVIVAGFGAVAWLLGGTRTTNRSEVTISFPGSITGLAPGASVQFNGIRIGEVTRFDYVEDDPTKVLVIASIDNRAPVKLDSRVTLGYSGLTGSATVQISGGSKSAERLMAKGSPRHMQAEAGAVQDLMEGAKTVLGKADAALNSINSLVRDNSDSIGRTVRNAEAFSDSLAKNAGNIDAFMANVGRAADVLAQVSGKAEGLIAHADELVKAVEPAKVRSTVDDVARIAGEIAKSSGEFDGIVRQVRAAADQVAKVGASADLALGDARKIIAAVDPAKIKATVDGAAEFAAFASGKTKDVDDIIGKAKAAAGNIETVTGGLAARKDDIDSVLRNARTIAERLEEASRRVDGILAKIDGVVGSDQAQGLFSQGRTFLEEATATAKSFRETSDSIRGRVGDIADGINRLTSTGTREIKELVANGQRTLNSIDRTVNNLDREPQRLIFGGSGGRVQEFGPGRR
jgi:phospholipid/cholesterol/gamma-HCH transport system substrate-binding protein